MQEVFDFLRHGLAIEAEVGSRGKEKYENLCVGSYGGGVTNVTCMGQGTLFAKPLISLKSLVLGTPKNYHEIVLRPRSADMEYNVRKVSRLKNGLPRGCLTPHRIS